MSNPNRDLIFTMLRFLREEKLEATLHQLERETGCFFNLQYFEQKFLAGDWDEVETYLSSFTKPEDHRSSMELFFEIRTQKYIEALENPNRDKAMQILRNELEVFSSVHSEVYEELSSLLLLQNVRQHPFLASYKDAGSARRTVLVKLKKLVETNPFLQNKLEFPPLQAPNLQERLNQTSNPMALRPANAPFIKREDGGFDMVTPKTEIITEDAQDDSAGDSDNTNQSDLSIDEIPRVIIWTLTRDSDVTSLDFHPSLHTVLAAGYKNGELALWEIKDREMVTSKPFEIHDISSCSKIFQDTVRDHPSMSVTRLSWNPDGCLIGVAFEKHLVHVYIHYRLANELQILLEIDAHIGAVNDLAFCFPRRHLALVTCGDDKLIKVWDMTGEQLFQFEGHAAPVYSVCPHRRGNDRFVVSAAIDGQIKIWRYGEDHSRVEFNTPDQWYGRLLYDVEGDRLFSGGTNKDRCSYLVEWDERNRTVKRTYSSFRLISSRGIMQFDIAKNRFLAAGIDRQIKFWKLDDVAYVAATYTNGGLPSLPLVRFNKEGNLLAVTTADGGFKILANREGLRSVSSSSAETASSGGPSNSVASTQVRVNRRYSNQRGPTSWGQGEYVHPSQCVIATLPISFDTSTKVVCLMYNYAGNGIIALGSNGLLKLWRWIPNSQNPQGKPSARFVPLLWRPRTHLFMINEISQNTEEVFPFIALTRTDDYLISASGGQVSLYNTRSFKAVQTYRPQSNAVLTHVAFHILDNNILALGMEDGTISIYNIKYSQVLCTLKGHRKQITGLTFSIFVGLLVSSGADAQIFLWDIIAWGTKERVPLILPAGKPSTGVTRVEFLHGGALLLVSHETQIAIFDPSNKEWFCRWMPHDPLPAPITSASSSASGRQIYAAFLDGNIGVFETEDLKLVSRISPSAYCLAPTRRNVYPLVVAAHPDEDDQIAVGLSDGSVKVIEPPAAPPN